MKEKHTGKTSRKPTTDWARLKAMTDAEIRQGVSEDADILPTDAAFWTNAKVVYPKAKESVTIRLDADILTWFRKRKGYQTRINAILRTYVEAQAQGPRPAGQ